MGKRPIHVHTPDAYTFSLQTLANVWRNRVCMNRVHMNWLFSKIWPADQKKKAKMINANNQPANPIANVGHQQQQARQRARNNAPQYNSTEIQGLLNIIEEILPVHWRGVGRSVTGPCRELSQQSAYCRVPQEKVPATLQGQETDGRSFLSP